MKNMEVYFYSLKGLREQNEDSHKIITNGKSKDSSKAKVNFFAIYDGHGGKEVSKFLEQNMYKYFLMKEVKYPLTKAYVNKVYDHLQSVLKNKYRFSSYSGSTSLAVINYKKNGNTYINLINTGDCRAVICRDGLAIALTLDHKPNFPKERMRIEKLGGNIVKDGLDYRIKDLSVSRAFGDTDATPFVTHRGDLFSYRLYSNDKFLIMACDGLWDVLSNQEAVNFVIDFIFNKNLKTINKSKKVAKALAEYALRKGSTDNISVIIIIF